MTLEEYIDSLTPDEKARFAALAGTKVSYLTQVKRGHRRPSIRMAKRMVAASGGALSMFTVRPDIFASG